jgi:hypothetical protein
MNDRDTPRASNSSRLIAWAVARLGQLRFAGFLAGFMTLMFVALGGAAIISAIAQGHPLRLGEVAAMAAVWAATLIILVVSLAILERVAAKFSASRYPPSEAEFDAGEIRCSGPRGKTNRMAWDSIARVLVITTDGGPFVEDMFWVIVARTGQELVIESGAKGASLLLAEMQARLAGFDNEAFVKAVGSTTPAVLEIWCAPDEAHLHR